MIEMMCHVHHIFFAHNDVISLELRTLITVYMLYTPNQFSNTLSKI